MTWRQHRATLIGLIPLVVVMAAYTAVYGTPDAWHRFLPLRRAWNRTVVQCQVLLQATYAVLFSGFLIPVALGMLVGAPLLARETAGTARFAWTQGAGRIRPTLAKLILLGLAVLAAAVILGWLNRWAVEPRWPVTAVTQRMEIRFCSPAPGHRGGLRPALLRGRGTGLRADPGGGAGHGRDRSRLRCALPVRLRPGGDYWMLGFGMLRTTYPGFGVSQPTGRAANLHAPVAG